GLFDRVGCATCHVRNIVTVPAGTKLNGGTYTVPAALGNGLFHPFSDFLLHDVGTGDGIEIAVVEHFGKRYAHMQEHMSPTANRIRTAPLWGVRLRSRLMHDGESLTLRDAIERHRGEASDAFRRFSWLGESDQEAPMKVAEHPPRTATAQRQRERTKGAHPRLPRGCVGGPKAPQSRAEQKA